MRSALAGVVVAMLGLGGVELGSWAAERLGYVELYGEGMRARLTRWHKVARWGLALLAIPLVVLIVLVSRH